MPLTVLLPVIVLAIVLIGGFVWYRRTMRSLEPDDDQREIGGTRLTSENLRRLSAPPWRVAFEIGANRLGGVDHVVVGPPGVIAVVTIVTDRPSGEINADATLIASAATMRAGVDELVQPLGLRCDLLAKVFWGAPQPDLPASIEITHGSLGVEGQRLDGWLESLPSDVLTGSQIDLAWQAVLTGIGRPDPLT